ncbi:MAG TPA: 2Fe-2S iron-sulfur cluster-binding protein, partial [Candidatus Limnocylindrales bacterium]
MTDLIERPPSEVVPSEPGTPPGPPPPIVPRQHEARLESRPDMPIKRDTLQPMEDSLAERYLTTQSPQRPQSTPRIRIEVDGRIVEGTEGQTILEVCRDNGIEIPTLCYEPKLPGFGACRMCVVEVEGEEHPPISCS